MDFPERGRVAEIEEGNRFMPKFDDAGLIPCVTQDAATSEVLMLGYMNREALAKTIETGHAHYWSRSRKHRSKGGRIVLLRAPKPRVGAFLTTSSKRDCCLPLILPARVMKPCRKDGAHFHIMRRIGQRR